jgi:hypothetical protein
MFHDQKNGDPFRTIKLSRDEVRWTRRLLQLLIEPDADAAASTLPDHIEETSRYELISRAREDFRNRRRRAEIFGPSMFGEAAWDMLLTLYIAEMIGQRQTVGRLLEGSGAPQTTALRWLEYLTTHELADREPHPTDKRTSFVKLTVKARQMLDLYYSGPGTNTV